MTEAEWLDCQRPASMIAWIKGSVSARKCRLFVCACCRALLDELTPGRRIIDVLERHADGLAQPSEVAEAAAAQRQARELWSVIEGTSSGWAEAMDAQARALMLAAQTALSPKGDAAGWSSIRDLHPGLQCHLLRDIFGNPVRPATASFLTTDVRALTAAAYDERSLPGGELDGARLAILADALEETGCADEALPEHLRAPGPHVRGCWALDRLLR